MLIPVRDGILYLYVIRTVWLIRKAKHTNRVSTLCAGFKFRIAIRLVRLIRKCYLYGSGVIHTLRPMRRLLQIRTQRSDTHLYVCHPYNPNRDTPRTNLKPNGVIRPREVWGAWGLGKMFQHVRKCLEPSRTVPYPSEPPHTIHMVRIKFHFFLN